MGYFRRAKGHQKGKGNYEQVGTCPKATDPSCEAHQGVSGVYPVMCKEDPRPMNWFERLWHPGPKDHMKQKNGPINCELDLRSVSYREGRWCEGSSLCPCFWEICQVLEDHWGVQAGAIYVSLSLEQSCKEKAERQARNQVYCVRQWLLQNQQDLAFGTQTSVPCS